MAKLITENVKVHIHAYGKKKIVDAMIRYKTPGQKITALHNLAATYEYNSGSLTVTDSKSNIIHHTEA